MKHQGVMITAGYDQSLPSIALAECLRRQNVEVLGCIVVSPFSMRRLRSLYQRVGIDGLMKKVSRLRGSSKYSEENDGPLTRFLQKNGVQHQSLRSWSKNHEIPYIRVKDINSRKTVQLLNRKKPAWLIYSGGGILRKPILNTMEGRILNAHQGSLPQTRGMNAAEWSVLLDIKTESTIHLIDEGIDTGKIILRIPYEIEPGDSRRTLREKAIISGIQGLLEVAAEPNLNRFQMESNSVEYRQCFTLSGAMSEILEVKLANRGSSN